MTIGLAVYESKIGDTAFNLSQIEKGLKAASGRASMLVFGEAFLQGFDCLSWNYEKDRETAVSRDSALMRSICGLSKQYGTDLVFGYIERDGETLYSSCAVIIEGELKHNYRRISRGWKEFSITDRHYAEGTETVEFDHQGEKLMLSLCGDMFDFPERFKTRGVLIWPVFVNYELTQWEGGIENEYAEQALLASERTLMVNSISRETDPESVGGAFYFKDGKVSEKFGYEKEGVFFAGI